MKDIFGIKIIKKKILKDKRGKIIHMLRNDDPNFTKFGEIYFSVVNPKIAKAWHIHKRMTLNYVAVFGSIKLVLYDDRKNSPTKGKIQEIKLSEKNHFLVSVPPYVWNGFCSLNKKNFAILANCSNIPHDRQEIIRIPYNDKSIPYKWEL